VNNRLWLGVPLVVFLTLAALFYRGLSLDPTEMPSALIGKEVPAFQLPELQTAVQLTEQKIAGSPYLLNVWATWCIACKVEHPVLNQLKNQGVRIIGINYKDEDQAAMQWLDKYGNPYEANIVDASGRLGIDLGVFGAPETYVVDAAGKIHYKHVGVVTMEVWNETLAPLYNQLTKENVAIN
jgi:cytochrome c biogenesis protein CcmG/thiol:disulfide interchange protein DsbE